MALLERIAQVRRDRMAALRREIEDLDNEAEACEQQARDDYEQALTLQRELCELEEQDPGTDSK